MSSTSVIYAIEERTRMGRKGKDGTNVVIVATAQATTTATGEELASLIAKLNANKPARVKSHEVRTLQAYNSVADLDADLARRAAVEAEEAKKLVTEKVFKKLSSSQISILKDLPADQFQALIASRAEQDAKAAAEAAAKAAAEAAAKAAAAPPATPVPAATAPAATAPAAPAQPANGKKGGKGK